MDNIRPDEVPYQCSVLPAGSWFVVAPHPDDETFGMGGSMLLASRNGIEVHLCVMTDGRKGGNGPSPHEIAEIRKKELEQASELIGIKSIVYLNEPDGELAVSDRIVGKLESLIEEQAPQSVFMPSPTEFHPDHQVTAEIVWAAMQRSREASRATLYHYEITGKSEVNTLIDITSVAAQKYKAVRLFSSQLKINNYLDAIEGLDKLRTYTLENSVQAAEGFYKYPNVNGELRLRTLKTLEKYWTTNGQRIAPLVSIVVRTRNRREFLKEALNSVVQQDWPEIDLVVINDGGEDVNDIVIQLEKEFSNCTLIQFDRTKGRSHAANAGIAASKGEFIGFLDDDDWLEPGHIAVLVGMLSKKGYKEHVAAYGNVDCIDSTSSTAIKRFGRDFDSVLLSIENYIPIHALLFRRSVLSKEPVCKFDENLDIYEDWDFWMQLMMHGRFVYVDQLVGKYRVQDGSGAGYQEDHLKAMEGLRTIIAKWAPRWMGGTIIEIVGRARFLDRKLQETEEERVRLAKEQQRLIIENRGLSSSIEKSASELESLTGQCSEMALEINELVDSYEQKILKIEELYEKKIEAQKLYLDTILSSRSWLVTKPLRYARRSVSLLQVNGSQIVWNTALRIYRIPVLQGVVRRLPVTFKQRLRNILVPKFSAVGSVSKEINSSPFVSIIIPVYNHSDHIEQCINSALKQTYRQLEVIVCDDASTDDKIREILKKYEGIGRIKVFYNTENKGISKTQNFLLKKSKGEIIGFLDCDDYLHPDAVARCVSEWNERTVYLHTGRINVDKNGKEVNRISFEHLPRKDYFEENMERMFATHFKLIHRDAFARVGLFDPRFDSAQDYDILMRIAFHYPNEAFYHLPEFLYFHRLHAKQATESMGDVQDVSTTTIQNEARLRQSIRNGEFNKFISFIMLSYEKGEQTRLAVESIEKTVSVPHEIILYDNGSSETTVKYIDDQLDGRYENLITVYGNTNLGPAKGRHEALKFARGSWIIIFDNDEIAEPGWIEELLVRGMSDQSIGSVSCKVIFPDETLQFTGGYIRHIDDELVSLELYDRGKNAYDLSTAEFRECDWNPIGATLFTENPIDLLHDGYPNVFEDAGVSMQLRKRGKRLVNCPASWVWHDHMTYRSGNSIEKNYVKARYDPKRMMKSLSSFYKENGLIIDDEYVWRENNLRKLDRKQLCSLLKNFP